MSASGVDRPLSQIAVIGAGNPAPQNEALFKKGVHPFFRTSDVGQIKLGSIFNARDRLNDQGIVGLRLHPKGTILFPKSGASTFLNHRVIMGVHGYVSSHLATIYPKENTVDSRYLFYFLRTIRAQDLVQDSKYPSLSLESIKQIPIRVPPIAEQQRIVEILDKAFANVGVLKTNTLRNLANLRELFNSHLDAVFSEGQKRQGWELRCLKELCEKITDGTHQTPTYFDSGFMFLSSRNVVTGTIDWRNVKYIDAKQHGEMHKRVAPRVNDILLAKNGTTGVGAIVDRDEVFDIYVSLALLRPMNTILPRFLLHFINSPVAKRQFNKRLKGSGVSNLHLEEIREVAVPLPKSMSEQDSIALQLDSFAAKVKLAEAAIQLKLEAIARLEQSLLHAAFDGEL